MKYVGLVCIMLVISTPHINYFLKVSEENHEQRTLIHRIIQRVETVTIDAD